MHKLKSFGAGVRRFSSAHLLAVAALFVALGGTSYAAKSLIDGGDIKNSSIKSVDIKNGSLQSKDFSKGAKKALRGPKGAKGDTGPQGPQGPAGPVGPAGGGIRVLTADNTSLGALLTLNNANARATYLSPEGRIYVVDTETGAFELPKTVVYFEGDNCGGNAFVAQALPRQYVLASPGATNNGTQGDPTYVVSGAAQNSKQFSSSLTDVDTCDTTDGQLELSPVSVVGQYPGTVAHPLTIG